MKGAFPFKEAIFLIQKKVESADQSLPVSKGVILFLSSMFPLEEPLQNEAERQKGAEKKREGKVEA